VDLNARVYNKMADKLETYKDSDGNLVYDIHRVVTTTLLNDPNKSDIISSKINIIDEVPESWFIITDGTLGPLALPKDGVPGGGFEGDADERLRKYNFVVSKKNRALVKSCGN